MPPQKPDYNDWEDITPKFNDWEDITPKDSVSWGDMIMNNPIPTGFGSFSMNQMMAPTLPARPKTTPEFQETLKGWGAPQGVIDYGSYLPRFGDWAYESLARPASSALGMASLPLGTPGVTGGKALLGAMGMGFGGMGLYHNVPKMIEDPSMENVLDTGLSALMFATGPGLAKRGLGEVFPKAPEPPPPGTQMHLPGMENVQEHLDPFGDFNQRMADPTYTPPKPPTAFEQRQRAFTDMEQRAEQQVLELKMQRAEAVRNGDLGTVARLNQEILDTQSGVNTQKSNWRLEPPPPESPAPVFPDMGGEQGSLNFDLYRNRGTGRYMQPPSVESGMRGGVERPSEWQVPEQSVPEDLPFTEAETPVTEEPVTEPVTQDTLPKYVELVNMSDKTTIDMWKSRGYVQGPPSARGRPQLMRPDLATTVVPEQNSAFERYMRAQQSRESSPIGEGQVAAGDTVPIPNENVSRAEPNMLENGYRKGEVGPTHTLFHKIKDFIKDTQGAIDPEDDIIVRIIRSLTGRRRPSFAERPPRIPIRGDEEIPAAAFQPDEGVSTNREFQENHFLPESEGGQPTGRIVSGTTRAEINRETEIQPEGMMNEIKIRYPDILEEAAEIYNETDPQRIVENFKRYTDIAKEVRDRFNEAVNARPNYRTPIDPELEGAYYRIHRLYDLAQSKYERAGTRIVKGETETPHGALRQFMEDAEKFFDDEQGAIDPNDEITVRIAKWVVRKFQEKFGREPSPAELEQGVTQERQDMGPQPGEPTGRVAQFPGTDRLSVISQTIADLMGQLRTTTDSAGRRQIMDNVQALQRERRNLIQANQPPQPPATITTGTASTAVDAQFMNRMRNTDNSTLRNLYMDWSRQHGDRSGFRPRLDAMQAELIRRGWDPQTGDFPPPRTRMSEYSGTHEPWPEEGNLTPMEVAEPDQTPFDADLRNIRERQRLAEIERNRNQPEQENLFKRFLSDESGEYDPMEAMRKLKEILINARKKNMPEVLPAAPGEPTQLSMDTRIGGNPPLHPELGMTKQAQAAKAAELNTAILRRRVQDIVDLTKKIKEVSETTNDPQQLADLRATLRSTRKNDYIRVLDRADEFLERARRADEDGNPKLAEGYREQANRYYAETAGQLKLEFLRSRLKDIIGITPEQLDRALDSVDAKEISGFDHEYAKNLLDTLENQDGPPGLSEEVTNISSGGTQHRITYRSPSGKPIGYASIKVRNGKGKVGSFGIDKDAGLLYGKAALAIRQKLLELNAVEPGGGYSKHTYRAIQGMKDLLKGEEGYLDIGKLAEAFGEGYDKVKELFKSGRVNDLVRRFWSEEVGAVRVPNWKDIKNATGWGQGNVPPPPKINRRLTPNAPMTVKEFVSEALEVPSALTTTGDMSYPGRQGLALMFTPEFWTKAMPAMFKAIGPKMFDQIHAELLQDPIFAPRINQRTGARMESFGEEIGVKIFEPASKAPPTKRMQNVASRWAETGGSIPYLSAAWRHTAGYPIRATNRMYLTMGNVLRVNRTSKLLNLARDMSIRGQQTGRTAMPGVLGGIHLKGGGNIGLTQKVSLQEALQMDPFRNLQVAREIADFVNTATGAAPQKTHWAPYKHAEFDMENPTNVLEKSAAALSELLFSKGLFMSRVRMLNPFTYIMASPMVRKQYFKAALSTAAAWYTFTTLIKNADVDAEVSDEPTSADFGKVRIGNSRFDMSGSFIPFMVAASRMWQGGSTSSSTGQFHKFGVGYQAQTQEDLAERMFTNKLKPIPKFLYDVASATGYKPFHVGDRTMQLFIPLAMQDLWELHKERPDLVPKMAFPIMFGGGSQIYDKGESVGKFIDPENDWIARGGGIRDLLPENWRGEQ